MIANDSTYVFSLESSRTAGDLKNNHIQLKKYSPAGLKPLPLRILAKSLAVFTGCVVVVGISQSAAQAQPLGEPAPFNSATSPTSDASAKSSNRLEFDANGAFRHLEEVCDFGRRFSTSHGMSLQQKYLRKHFESLGAEVFLQPFPVRNPVDGHQVQLANMVVRFQPHRSKRLLFCCHYDTRPFPDRDPRNPQGTFIGANDGASGVAVLCELGRHIDQIDLELNAASSAGTGTSNLPSQTNTEFGQASPTTAAKPVLVDDGGYGVDLVFFDGEEFVYVHRRDPMFLGSTFFANAYVNSGNHPPKNHANKNPWQNQAKNGEYVFAILVDMVGDKNLQLYYEINSLNYAPRLTKSIWDVASRLKAKAFIAKAKHTLRDDHLPLNQIARIPTCDIIDFDFPSPRRKHIFWHTEQDIPENCSAKSLGTVGSVLLQWLREIQQLVKNPSAP